VIDFGSSCLLTDRLASYICSRSYRAPEIILGLPYDGKIDVWSLGCILAEQYTGYVLFANDSVQTILARMWSVLGPFPQAMLTQGMDVDKYFSVDRSCIYEETAPDV
jgi:dual specificity tyrosine-phosphorylation-regulated kinase 2/3/4